MLVRVVALRYQYRTTCDVDNGVPQLPQTCQSPLNTCGVVLTKRYTLGSKALVCVF